MLLHIWAVILTFIKKQALAAGFKTAGPPTVLSQDEAHRKAALLYGAL